VSPVCYELGFYILEDGILHRLRVFEDRVMIQFGQKGTGMTAECNTLFRKELPNLYSSPWLRQYAISRNFAGLSPDELTEFLPNCLILLSAQWLCGLLSV
jgi:hypothetical protein